MSKPALVTWVVIFLSAAVIGCGSVPSQPPVAPAQQQSPSEAGIPASGQYEPDNGNQIVFNETLEKYYDYFRANDQIRVFFDGENSFTDYTLATFAIMSLDNYSYENGNTKEEYDAVTEKYFGRKIKDFNNGASEIIPGTEMVRATGWSYDSSAYMVLRSLVEEPDGSKTAEFYTLNISDSVISELPQKTGAEMKNDLLSGDFAEYGDPFILKIRFEEKTDAAGNIYLKYLAIEKTDASIDTVTPYGS